MNEKLKFKMLFETEKQGNINRIYYFCQEVVKSKQALRIATIF